LSSAPAVEVALGEERDPSQSYQHAVDGDAGALAVAEVGVQVWGVHFFGVGQVEAAGVPDGDVEVDQVRDRQGVIENALGELVGGPGLQRDQDRQEVLGEPRHGLWAIVDCVGGGLQAVDVLHERGGAADVECVAGSRGQDGA
jgi:hypothetical protein